MDYITKYEKMVSDLVNESFQLLKGKKIALEELDTNLYRAHVKYTFSGLKIIISTQLSKFPNWKVRRILIHELCHLEIFLRWGVIRTNIDWIIYLMSKKHRVAVEREANILMIRKGYGKLILTTIEENKKRGLSYSLTKKEVLEEMKNVNNNRN